MDAVDLAYFATVIKPVLKDPLVDFIGEIDDEHKSEFLGNAVGLLFPIHWPEPFGLSTWTDVLPHFLLAAPRNTNGERLLKMWKNLRPGT